MKNNFLILLVCFFAFQIKSQNNADSINIKNKQLIDALKNRVNTIENIGNPNNVYLDEIAKLKTDVNVKNDSIEKLNRLISLLRKGQSGKVNASEMSYLELNTSLNRNSITFQQLTNCNCFRLFYKPYQTELDFKTFSELDSIVTILKSNPKARLKLIGHADKSGHEEENLVLSENRVITLKNYLVSSKGVNATKINIEWHGSAMPEVDTKDADRQYLNRRVEVVVLNK